MLNNAKLILLKKICLSYTHIHTQEHENTALPPLWHLFLNQHIISVTFTSVFSESFKLYFLLWY